jgi:hypothetical protein
MNQDLLCIKFKNSQQEVHKDQNKYHKVSYIINNAKKDLKKEIKTVLENKKVRREKKRGFKHKYTKLIVQDLQMWIIIAIKVWVVTKEKC